MKYRIIKRKEKEYKVWLRCATEQKEREWKNTAQ